MRLVELEPRWFAEPGREGQGVSFVCPHCAAASDRPDRVRVAVAFANPLDGGAPISLASPILWPTLWPPKSVPDVTTVPPGVHWQRTGETFETLTLAPSVDASPAGHWHGHVQEGECL